MCTTAIYIYIEDCDVYSFSLFQSNFVVTDMTDTSFYKDNYKSKSLHIIQILRFDVDSLPLFRCDFIARDEDMANQSIGPNHQPLRPNTRIVIVGIP